MKIYDYLAVLLYKNQRLYKFENQNTNQRDIYFVE